MTLYSIDSITMCWSSTSNFYATKYVNVELDLIVGQTRLQEFNVGRDKDRAFVCKSKYM